MAIHYSLHRDFVASGDEKPVDKRALVNWTALFLEFRRYYI